MEKATNHLSIDDKSKVESSDWEMTEYIIQALRINNFR